MKNFIKLTANTDANNMYIWVNVSQIVRFEDFYDKHTKIYMADGKSFWVIESVEEVIEKIGA
jgi:uncharacterized protein YlzI (FlbEa/FlbD family)